MLRRVDETKDGSSRCWRGHRRRLTDGQWGMWGRLLLIDVGDPFLTRGTSGTGVVLSGGPGKGKLSHRSGEKIQPAQPRCEGEVTDNGTGMVSE